jgi:hypothetical protein
MVLIDLVWFGFFFKKLFSHPSLLLGNQSASMQASKKKEEISESY